MLKLLRRRLRKTVKSVSANSDRPLRLCAVRPQKFRDRPYGILRMVRNPVAANFDIGALHGSRRDPVRGFLLPGSPA